MHAEGRAGHEVPGPGRLTSFLLRRRLSVSQRNQLMSELAELHEHRVVTRSRAEADAWLRREYRRWTVRLLRGGIAEASGLSDMLRSPGGGGLLGDLRHNFRGLRRAPLFSAAIVLTVGLGIGGTALVYGIVHAILISPLPYPDADRMVLLRTLRGEDMWGTSMADLEALYDPPPAFEAIAGYTRRTASVAIGDGVELIRSKWVTDNYFPLLGIEPVQGRLFTPEEGRAGGEAVVLITEGYWERALSSDPEVIGSSLVVSSQPHTIVGILPDQLGPLDRGGQIFPVLQVDTPPRQGPFFFFTVGRIRDGVDPAVAAQQLDAVAKRMFPIWRDSFTFEDATLGFRDLKEMLVGNVARTLLMVFTAVAFLLVIASANAASLLVARGVARQREVAIRAALGASGGRLLQLLLSEAAILASGGALMGLAITVYGMELVRRMGAGQLPRVEEIALTAPVVVFFLAVTLGSWALFGLVASAGVMRRRLEGIASSSVRSTASKGMRRLRRGLVASQFAVSIPLLIGAGLLGSSLDRLQSQGFGFEPENFVSALVSLPSANYPDEPAVRAFWDEVLPQIEALPDVAEAGLANARPPVEYPESNNFVLADHPPDPDEPVLQAPWITADPGYFEALGVPLIEGRIFNDPRSDTMRTAVVDQAWADRFFPGRSAIGRRMRAGGCTVDGCPYVEVVGVVSNVKTTGLDDRNRGTIYYDFRRDSYSAINLHLRTRSAPLDVIPEVRRLVLERDASIPFAQVMTAGDVAAEWLQGRKYTSMLVALLAGIALLLSVVGIYGAMSYFVRQHTRDIGIRIALGGGPRSALRLVLAQGMRVAVLGTLLGLAGALLLTRYMGSLLYDVTATDPLVFATVCAGTLIVALAASAIPGGQAAATDPATTLREE